MPREARRLHGRERELAALSLELEAAYDSSTRIVVLHGDAGIGKTALMETAARSAPDRARVLSVRNLPLTTRMPNLAVRTLLAQAEGGRPLREEIRRPLPLRLDAAIERLTELGPVVVTVDDLQWADSHTLDALMFVVGGADDRPLAILTTVRSGTGRPVDRWRADLLRLPGARSVPVQPLDRLGMHDLIAAQLGAPPHDALVRDVLDRTGGNPYHAQLLLEGVEPTALAAPPAGTPSGASGDLGTALLQTWATLPARTRELTVLLAIHGKPIRLSILAGLDPAWGEAANELQPALATHVLDHDDSGRVWFHHPLIAELLVTSVPDDELRRQHATLAHGVERLIEVDGATPDRIIDLADHLAGAGDVDGCFAASRRALGALHGSDEPTTELRLIRRCVELAPGLQGAGVEPRALLAEWAAAAAAAESDDDEYAAVVALLDSIGPDDPLARAELLLHRRRLEVRLGGDLGTATTAREAFELTVQAPDSRQYALALAELVHAEIMEGDPSSVAHAEEALRRAEQLDDTEALSYALAASAELAAATRDLPRATRLAEETFAIALPAGHFEPARLAALWLAYSMPGYRAAAEGLRDLRGRLAEAGAPRLSIAALACIEAGSWMTVGATPAVRDALRVVRAEDTPDYIELAIRSISARFAALRGRVDEAEAHLQRAHERFPDPPAYAALERAVAQALTSLAGDDPDGALDALIPMIEGGPGGHGSEWLMPLAARALADRSTAARDGEAERPGTPTALEMLDELEAEHPHVISRTMGISYADDLDALDALYAAERSRARNLPDGFDRWVDTADRAAAADLAWEEAYACRRGAEQGLIDGGARRRVGIALLRRGAAIAHRTEADGLAAELETLARWARIRLQAEGTARAEADRVAGVSLTGRERELLPYLVDGRTYAEIAELLTISEKTVSSHVSNLLRKTGAANRIDLARMVRETHEI
ncbi:helix-turn-helix transcriptional regulator [Agromyces italicus]|uniref:helix-turn-helix transcriptional regulator n=1 Tax=Agromyces italicus TaxID=279572 RepID=UPI0003B36F42|nr:AAA family ATPase [Agromyces italicus]